MNKVGLLFGSFNPIHIGHMIIAEYFTQHSDLKEVWFVISPHNPLKDKKSLLADRHRLALVRIAVEDNPAFKVSDIEFKMPQPSYTVKTLAYLSDKYPDKEFVLLMGTDNLKNLHKWKNYEHILKYYRIYVYPRRTSDISKIKSYPDVKMFNAPLIEISATSIRNDIKARKSVRYLLPEKVHEYILEMHFYEK
jgi:nicotinate-nucleotide adenylyltransferase